MLDLIKCLFQNTFTVFAGVNYPGLNIPVLAVYIGIVLITASILLFKLIVGSGQSVAGSYIPNNNNQIIKR